MGRALPRTLILCVGLTLSYMVSWKQSLSEDPDAGLLWPVLRSLKGDLFEGDIFLCYYVVLSFSENTTP